MPRVEMVTGSSHEEEPCSRIAVVLEPGRSGAAALAQATALAAAPASELTVVAIAPTAATGCRSCGGPSPHAYNCAVRDDIAQQLRNVTAQLRPVAQSVKAKLLVEGTDPPLETWVAQGRFDLVLLPARLRVLRSRSHPAARLLRRFTDANVRVVSGFRRRLRGPYRLYS